MLIKSQSRIFFLQTRASLPQLRADLLDLFQVSEANEFVMGARVTRDEYCYSGATMILQTVIQ